MPEHNNRTAAKGSRLARRANSVNPKRLDLLGKILEESSSIALNDIANHQSARQALDNHSKLFELIDELRQVESSCNPKLPERNEQSWNDFFNWIDAELKSETETKISASIGISRRSLVCRGDQPEGEEYALIAKAPFKKGQDIFGIQRGVMLSTESVTEDPDLFEFICKDSIASSMQNVILVLHLLNEYSKGTKSCWHPYLAILPHKILPVLTLTKDELICLLASSHLFEALKMIRAIARQYSYFFKRLQATNLPLSKDFTFEYYSWGVSMVCSRQNEIPPLNRQASSLSVIHALIPILDMCNHDRLSNQATFEDNQSRLIAFKDLNINDEITINYGSRSSGDFYIHNGFVPEEVPFDIVPLTIVLNNNGPLFDSKIKLLKILNMPSFGRFRLTHNNYENRHKRDPHLTMFLIVYFLSQEELKLIMESDNPVGMADEIYEYVQYNELGTDQSEICNCQNEIVDEMAGETQRSEILAMKIRLSKCIKEYLSKRAAIGIALIDRAISEFESINIPMLTMLKHERSIYQSHLINCNAN